MGEGRIAMQNRRVGIVLSDGSRLEGEVFLSLFEAHRDGPQRLGDLLNGEDRFLPVRTAEGVLLVKVSSIVTASTCLAEEDDGLMRFGTRYHVQITTMLQDEISADLFVNLPETHRRVKDCLNQAARFIPVFVAEEVLFLNTDYVLYVRD